MLWAILVYAAALAAAGLYFGRRVHAAADFFVASRGLPAGLLFSTFLAANLGAGATVGVAQLGYQYGLAAWWWVGSAGIGSLLLAYFVGPRIWAVAAEHDLYTVGDYLELRYSRSVRLLLASFLWLGSLAILAGQLIAMGFILEVAAGLPRAWGCALGGVLVTLYFAAGGLWGTARINLIQILVKGAGFCIAVPWVLREAGALGQGTPDPQAYLSVFGDPDAALGWALILIPSFLVSPGLLQKLFGARDAATVRRAVGAQGFVLLGYSFLPVLLGMAARALYPDLADAGLALPHVLAHALPTWIGGLLLAAIFSAEVSSADAVLFMISTSVARDLGQTLLKLPDAALLRWTRVTAVLAGAAGVALAVWLDSIIAALTLFYSLLTVTLFVPLLGGLYWSRPGPTAALASMLAGAAGALAFNSQIGIALAALAFLVFSPWRRPPGLQGRPPGRPSQLSRTDP
ncbi:MAG: sodium:solute symporter family protein [Bryobacterales bacterium]